jgi:hypothetical protein
LETKIQSPQEPRHSLAEAGSLSAADMRMVLDDIQVCISVARRRTHEAMQKSATDTRLQTRTRTLKLKRPLKNWPAESSEQIRLQKVLRAESSESVRLKAKLSGLWDQNLPLMDSAEVPRLIN